VEDALSIELGSRALGRGISEKVSKFVFGLKLQKWSETTVSHIGVAYVWRGFQTLTLSQQAILEIRPKFRICYKALHTTLKNRNFVILLIINYLVSYEVDKAYEVILGLILDVLAWTKTTFDRMRKTRHVS